MRRDCVSREVYYEAHSLGCKCCMQGSISGLQGRASIDVTDEGAPPTVDGRVELRTALRFLDNASSHWEWLLSPWALLGEYRFMQPAQTVASSASSSQSLSVSSPEHAILDFTPACLLVIGDIKSFAQSLLAPDGADDMGPLGGFPFGKPGISPGNAMLAKAERRADASFEGQGWLMHSQTTAPSMREQMALSVALTERMPQRYCIQNHLGVRLWYWAPSESEWSVPEPGASKQALGVGESMQLQCKPACRAVVMEGADGSKVLLFFGLL
jgi:hypothetical protein